MQNLIVIAHALDRLNARIGNWVSWLALSMVLVQFSVVVMRYIFSTGSIFAQESIIYMHSGLFMIGAGYTLLNNGHVRVDIFYRTASQRFKDWVDLLGGLLLLLPFCIVILNAATPYIMQSWSSFESSKETSGIPYVYLLKTLILIFTVLVLLQGFAIMLKAFARIRGYEVEGVDKVERKTENIQPEMIKPPSTD